jgi:hypothetical protein
MTIDETPDDPVGTPPEGPPPDARYFDALPEFDLTPEFDPAPEFDPTAGPRTLSPHVQRQLLLGRFLDDAEVIDNRLAMAAAARARSIDELRRVSVAIAREEEAEDAARPPELRASHGQEEGWSIQNRAKTELSTEIAMAYNLSKSAARALIEESTTLVADLPATLDALSCGTIRYEHAKVIVSTAWTLPVEARSAFEEEVLPWAKALILSAFKSKVVAAREKIHATTMAQRHEAASQHRTVSRELGEDGTGYLTIRDSNEVIAAIYNRLTDTALSTFAGDPRTLAQRRTDVATELLIKGDLCAFVDETEAADAGAAGTAAPDSGVTPAGRRLGHGIVARVHIEIPVLTLLGKDTAPATLEGRTPIDPVTARKLVADAPGFYRLLTDPITGSVVAFDDKFRYLPKSLRRAVELVDGSCTAPWCDATAREADGHHAEQWAATHDTSLANSALLCAPDHRLVHNTRWTMVKLPNGDKQWVSPCGRVKRVAPLRRLAPAFVEAMKADADTKPDAAEQTEGARATATGAAGWNSTVGPEEELPF